MFDGVASVSDLSIDQSGEEVSSTTAPVGASKTK
jgi:hypothetical protein